MQRFLRVLAVALLIAPGAASGHDLFLKLDSYFLEPGAEARVALMNGTFFESEAVVAPDRIEDASLVTPAGEVIHPAPEQWRDEGSTTFLDLESGEPGTWVLGVSTRPRPIELTAEEFNDYLRHDGVLDVLEERRRQGRLADDAREIYSKHVKAIFQVGAQTSDSYRHHLGYPVELIPVENPSSLTVGDTFQVLLLRQGRPLAGQLVYASHEGYAAEGGAREAIRTRTDDDGMARFELIAPGRWYVRLIHMVESDREGIDYVSNWATLTFEIRVRSEAQGQTP